MSRGLCVTILALVFLLLIGFFAERYEQAGSAVAAIIGVIVGAAITAGSQFMISGYERHHQLRMAALERRVEAHQEAFALWSKLLSSVYKPEINDVFNECQDWWYKNCLYLDGDGDARIAFRNAYMSALHHAEYVKARSYDSEFLKSNFYDITSAGNIILESVSLPPIRDLGSELGANMQDFQGTTRVKK